MIILLLIVLIVFGIIPLVISMTYGHIPFFDRASLESADILVTNNKHVDGGELSFLYNSIYTWEEITTYIIRREMTYYKVLRKIIVYIGVAVVAVIIDRTLIRGSGNARRGK